MADFNCKHAIGIAEHVRGTNPCDGTNKSLSEAIDVANCCRQGSQFDLAIELLDCVDVFPLSKHEPIASHVVRLRSLLAKRDTSALVDLDFENGSPKRSSLIRGWNFAKAMTRWASGGFPMRNQEEIEERLAICQQCPHLVDQHCHLCGCACVETNHVMNKLALKTEKCPIGKWE